MTSLKQYYKSSTELNNGKYQIVDQGQADVAGYTNEESGAYIKVPAIIFGDHTRIIKYIMYPDDLVISLTGTAGKDDYANVCVLPKQYPKYYLNQRNAKLEIKDALNNRYLQYVLKDKDIKGRLTGISRGIRQANISNADILNLVIPLPPLHLQNKFATIVTNIEQQKAIVKQSITQSQNLFNSLMSKYFDVTALSEL